MASAGLRQTQTADPGGAHFAHRQKPFGVDHGDAAKDAFRAACTFVNFQPDGMAEPDRAA
jgi:hypothetical protein